MSKRLEAAGDPDLRRALVLARSQAEPLSADDAAAQLGVHRNVARAPLARLPAAPPLGAHRNVARARLDRLVAAGFLRVFFARRGDRRGPGAGRPSKLYEV